MPGELEILTYEMKIEIIGNIAYTDFISQRGRLRQRPALHCWRHLQPSRQCCDGRDGYFDQQRAKYRAP